jgi:hypothetical protein
MRRRQFLTHLAVGVASAGFFLPARACAESVNIGIVPVGKRGRILAADLMRMVTDTTPFANVALVDASTSPGFRDQFDRVVIFGCLGGRTGLDDAANCGEIVQRSTGTATAVLLWPMDFEGSRLRASAFLAAGRLQVHGARLIPVTVAVPAYLTLDEARERREQALLESGWQEIKHF